MAGGSPGQGLSASGCDCSSRHMHPKFAQMAFALIITIMLARCGGGCIHIRLGWRTANCRCSLQTHFIDRPIKGCLRGSSESLIELTIHSLDSRPSCRRPLRMRSPIPKILAWRRRSRPPLQVFDNGPLALGNSQSCASARPRMKVSALTGLQLAGSTKVSRRLPVMGQSR